MQTTNNEGEVEDRQPRCSEHSRMPARAVPVLRGFLLFIEHSFLLVPMSLTQGCLKRLGNTRPQGLCGRPRDSTASEDLSRSSRPKSNPVFDVR